MIEISVKADKTGFVDRVTIKGHSGYAAHGQDIVCAAISALSYTLAAALSDMGAIDGFVERDGFMEIAISKAVDPERTRIITETIVKGFRLIEKSHKRHVLLKQVGPGV